MTAAIALDENRPFAHDAILPMKFLFRVGSHADIRRTLQTKVVAKQVRVLLITETTNRFTGAMFETVRGKTTDVSLLILIARFRQRSRMRFDAMN